jgi:hypothetical protein
MKKILYFAGAVMLFGIGCGLAYLFTLGVLMQSEKGWIELSVAAKAFWETSSFLSFMTSPFVFLGSAYFVFKVMDE